MTAAVAAIGNRYLPRGWRDFGRQLAIWFGFLLAYQVVRGIADRNPTRAFENGLRVIGVEEHVTGLFELSLQQVISSSQFLTAAVSWTYWNSEFTVVGLTLLWVYLRRNERFYRFRNWILLANAIGLIGYIARADRAAADVPGARVQGHAVRVRLAEPRLGPDRARVEPVRRDAEPPRS